MAVADQTPDAVDLEVRWSRVAAITDEAATTLLRAAFSTIIRESNDYTVVLMDPAGRTVAESRAGIPAFAALIGTLTARLLEVHPAETWHEGDVVITNDPWIATGHLPDIAMISPVFYGGALVAFAGSAAHVPDIGGTATLGATDLMAEGLFIPPIHLYRDGARNEGVVALLRANVRLPVQVWGDLEAQMAAHEVCRRRAVELLDDICEPDFGPLSNALHAMSDRSTRTAIAAIPDGVYRSSLDADGVEGRPTHIECAITVEGEHIEIDYAGSSPQVGFATNCTLNYTTAYSVYPLKLLLDPGSRTNHGSYRSITVKAPEGSILNPVFPAPVLARHLTGHLLSCAIYRALADVLPDRVLADSGGAPAMRVQFAGRDKSGAPFAAILFASAGMGACAGHDGRSTTAFPTNSGSGSIEALESTAPLLFRRKEFRTDSGGAGTRRGGLGQDIEIVNPGDTPLRVALLGDRSSHPALGIVGGLPGAPAHAEYDDGTVPALKSLSTLEPGSAITISFAGGGGYGPPSGRDRTAIAEDLRAGLITGAAAIRDYGTEAVTAARCSTENEDPEGRD
ncbi:hydantoinase B/oxoprolinase family protein [Actinospica sp. MGRD01-02]|uniref:Hydantoinase B/oxoprolinase family protein n=1 Tax=Actinospica acidithermotolerans TaxID=2828514 RepID=A0A941IFJ1_9ACTN|nr:hydantoinase B/oxoprolinase family protein [Actinospica acidithermotolerans]MBR7825104.1 hydantoinase B/oxoprolinase family protein [Actinospica acidithermotolerans]